ncbi:hypothetical protein Pint_13754 [Pistacia integerrima]|uniref:Uncharacterized protein n=1 Tax=Pistacia integerrima TaxID=434235 RepID=A0ACC0Y464_9ROSI|nr:hypothetical protein Pint_13754 [Pistacia integerrima]
METSTLAPLLPLASVSQQPYVSELLSFTLDRLHKPELLRVDAERIQRQMQEVAVGNYRVFIAAADALLVIREEVSSIDSHLESLAGMAGKNQLTFKSVFGERSFNKEKFPTGENIIERVEVEKVNLELGDLEIYIDNGGALALSFHDGLVLSVTNVRAMNIYGEQEILEITETPKLTSGCTEFIESAEHILENRKMNQTLLANHSTLLDLLEIPQLMDTYVFDKIMMLSC